MKNFLKYLSLKHNYSKFEILEILKNAVQQNVLKQEILEIFESLLNLEILKARDIMIPKHQVDHLELKQDLNSIIKKIADTGHSRFPVLDAQWSSVAGILHAKDLLKIVPEQEFRIKDLLREVFYVPAIKSLNSLLTEMRLRHIHLAMVVDEFTNIIGIITMEMIIEQLVGEIEDEYDYLEEISDIIEIAPNMYRINGRARLNQINQAIKLNLLDKDISTISSFMIKLLSRIPISGEIIELAKFNVEILASDSKKIKLLKLSLKK